jgi:hypothetical protein
MINKTFTDWHQCQQIVLAASATTLTCNRNEKELLFQIEGKFQMCFKKENVQHDESVITFEQRS